MEWYKEVCNVEFKEKCNYDIYFSNEDVLFFDVFEFFEFVFEVGYEQEEQDIEVGELGDDWVSFEEDVD